MWTFSNSWRNRWSAGLAGYKSHSLVPLSFSFHLCSFYPPKINLDPKRLTYFTVESAQQDNIQSYSAWWLGFSASAPLSITLALKWASFFIRSLCLAGVQHCNPRGVGGHGGFCDAGGEAGTCQHGEFESLTVDRVSNFKIRSSKQIKQPNLSVSFVFVIRSPAFGDAGCWGGCPPPLAQHIKWPSFKAHPTQTFSLGHQDAFSVPCLVLGHAWVSQNHQTTRWIMPRDWMCVASPTLAKITRAYPHESFDFHDRSIPSKIWEGILPHPISQKDN